MSNRKNLKMYNETPGLVYSTVASYAKLVIVKGVRRNKVM